MPLGFLNKYRQSDWLQKKKHTKNTLSSRTQFRSNPNTWLLEDILKRKKKKDTLVAGWIIFQINLSAIVLTWFAQTRWRYLGAAAHLELPRRHSITSSPLPVCYSLQSGKILLIPRVKIASGTSWQASKSKLIGHIQVAPQSTFIYLFSFARANNLLGGISLSLSLFFPFWKSLNS